MSRVLVTGGAGFIGSNLADYLADAGHQVRIFDNFSTGRRSFIGDGRHEIFEGSLLTSRELLDTAMEGVETVYHLSANADVRDGWNHPEKDLSENVIATSNVLHAAVSSGVKEFVFSSTGSVYGESDVLPTPENAPFPKQTSLYGASKASAESFIDAYGHAGKIKTTIFRFVSVLGQRYSHGHVIDFVRQLRKNPELLTVLGDGKQKKSYMLVDDCVRAVASLRGETQNETFNLGVNGYCEVNQSIDWICDELGLNPRVEFSGGKQGWIGDNPFIWLDVTKAANHGWVAETDIEQAVRLTVRWLQDNIHVLDA